MKSGGKGITVELMLKLGLGEKSVEAGKQDSLRWMDAVLRKEQGNAIRMACDLETGVRQG